MARTNDFTSRYLERRHELLGTGLSGGSDDQTNTRNGGSSEGMTPDAESGQTQGTQRTTTGGNDFTNGYLERRRKLMAERTAGQQRPSTTLSTTRPFAMSTFQRTSPFSFSSFQFLTTRPSGGGQSGSGQQQTSMPSATMSSADMSARMDELRELRDAAEKERNEARTAMNGARYMTQSQRDEWSARLEEAEANYSRYDQEYNDLLNRYYQTENEEKRTSIQQDAAMSEQYQSAQDIQTDMDKVTAVMAYTTTRSGDAAQVEEYKQYLFDKYGLDQQAIDQYAISGTGGAYVPRTDGGYNTIYDLYLELQEKKENAVSTLSEGGYDYERMTGYEDMLEDAAQYREDMGEWQEYAREYPILSSVDTLLTAPFQGLDFLRVMGQNIGQSDRDDPENYVPMNSYDMELTNYINAVRQTVSEEIEGATKWEIFDQNVAAFLYQTGMSIGDSSLNLLAFGPTGALVVGSSTAAANQAKDIIDRGGSKEQAFMGGMAAGAFEAIFEKVSIDNLLATKSVTGWQSWLKETAKQAGVEASEETFTEIANILADAAIMGDNSNFDVAVAEYVAQGMSREDAERQAFMDLIGQVVQAGVGGAISGGVMGGVVNGVNGATNAAYNRYNQQLTQENDVKNTPVLETTTQEGPVQSQNEGEIDSIIPEATRQAVEMLVRGEEISGNQAARIARNEEALALLTELTGESINTDAPLSRVKSDIRALARRGSEVSESAVDGGQVQQEAAPGTSQESAGRTAAQAAYDMSRMRRAAEASGFGESGQKALTAVYDGSVDAGSFYAGFSAYYEAGVSGLDVGKVRSEYTEGLNEAQRYAAYTAGQNDAAASLQREREGVQLATVYGDEAGFIPSEHSRNLSQDTVRFYNALGRATGTKITVTAATGEGGANGWYSNGTVYIAADAENAGEVVARHEITHRLQEIAPEAYRAYRDYAMNAMAERDGSTAALVERYRARYAESGVNLTTEQAMDEIAADFTEALTVDPSRFEALARENRSVARRVLDALKDFIRRVKSLFHGQGDQDRAARNEYGVDMATLEEAARLWEIALDAARSKVSGGNGTRQVIRNGRAVTVREDGSEVRPLRRSAGVERAAQYLATEEGQRVELSDRATRYSLREEEPPKKTGVAYKVFYAKDGQLYPPMVANPGGAGTPVGVWLDADIGQAAPPSKTGRMQVQAGGKGTNAAKSSLAFRPGWHLGDIPLAKQFARKNPETGVKDLFPANFVWAECEYAMDVDYQEEAMSYGYTENGKFRHSYAGLPKLPTDGYYRYRTNPNPDTVPWIITGAMRVRRILTDAETDAICREAGVEPMQRQGGPLDEAGLERLGLEAGDVTGNTRFSMKSAVEDNGTLLALHNLTEQNLRDALRLGGLPMPSIAIVQAQQGHAKYGPISLVFGKASIDPQSNSDNRVYGGDAYTPTAPRVEYEASERVQTKLRRMYYDLEKRMGRDFADPLYPVGNYLEDEMNRKGGVSGILEGWRDNSKMMNIYLEETGQGAVEPIRYRRVDRLDDDTIRQYDFLLEHLGDDAVQDLRTQEHHAPMPRRIWMERHGEAMENAYRAYLLDYGMTSEQADNAMENGSLVNGALAGLRRYLSKGAETVTEGIDTAATDDAIRAKVDKDAYNRWLDDLLDGAEKQVGIYNGRDLFTASGNPRSFSQLHYAYTLENIVRAMKETQDERGGQVWGVSAKTLQSVATSQYGSVQEIRDDSGRLGTVDDDTYTAQVTAIDEQISDIIQRVKQTNKAHSSNSFEESDIIGSVMLEAAKGKKTVDAIMRTFSGEGYKISSQTAQDLQAIYRSAAELPTEYFEAKPRRAVSFDEVLAAVVPDNMDAKLRADAERAGMRVLEYKSGNDTDRLAKVNSVEGARFSLKPTDSQGRELTQEQQEFFRDSKVVDAEGRLLVLYHQTDGDFTVFDPRHVGAGTTDSETPSGVFLKPTAEDIGLRGKRQMKLYANITNPLSVRDRAELSAWYRENIQGYTEAEAKVREIERAFHEEYEAAEARSDAWYEENYDDYAAGRITEEEVMRHITGELDEILTRWKVEEGEARQSVKALLNDYFSKSRYDGVHILEDAGSFGRSVETWIALRPEQVKNTTNQTPTSDLDIRRSIKGSDILRENAALQEENALLRERVEYWRGQTRRTERVTTDKKAVERAARELIRTYNADLTAEDITGDLQGLYDYIASGRDGRDELTYTGARRRSDAIARKIVENASVRDDEFYRQYKDLRDYFRTTKLTVSQEDSRDIPDYGAFRKKNFGRMNLGKGATNIDQVFQEASYLWPEFFDEQRVSHPMDQLRLIEEVLDGIYSVEERNPFGAYLDAAVVDVSNEIMERFFDLPQTRRTFADRQAAKLDEAKAAGRRRLAEQRERNDARLAQLRQQNRERVQRTIQRERETRKRQIDRLKTRHAARDAASRERRNARELRARISRHASELSRKLLRPSDKQHIPEGLRQAVASMLDAINLESVYTVDPATGKRRKGGNGDPTKRTEAFRALRQAYADIAKEGSDYTLVLDPDLMDNLSELEAMRDTPLAEMGTGQLTTVWAAIRAVEASVRTANRMLGASRFQTISQVAEGIRNDNILRQDRGDWRGVLGKVDKLVNLDMLTPQGYFHRLGKTGDALFQMLRSAQDRHIEIMRSAQQATQDIIGKTNVGQLEREMHTFDIDGQKVTMSTAQVMALYELMKRKQAQEHIFTGGIRPDTVRGGRGLRENRRADAVHVSIEDLAEITGVLTEEQVKIADALQKYMGGQLADLGNEASMEVYGYRKFTEPDYFPIQVDRNQTRQDIAKEAQAQTIAGRGFTKGTNPNANNAVMVGSIFDIFASHVNDMATYAAWLPTMENVRRIRDFTYRDSEGNRTGTVKSVIERVFGRNGNAYLNKLVDDLNQGVRTTGSGNFMDGIVGNYKAAAVAANLRVILQQPTAILRALNTLDAKYLMAGTVRRGNWERVMQYAPIARWKDWGYFDINTGRQMKDVLLGSDSRLEKLRQAGMAGAGKADSFAWARLWNAVEAETRDRRTELKPGTEAFYRAVAERFGEIIDQTQVVDGILQRSQIMRSPDGLTKMSTSFMGEPTKTYNMFVNAVYDLRHATGQEARSRAGKALARTSTALVVSFTVNAIMQSIIDGLRDDDKETDYWEKVFQAFTGFTGDEETFLDYWNSFWSGNLEANYNPLAYMPYFKDLVSIAQGFDVTRMDMEAVEQVWTAFSNMRKALSGEGRYSIAGASANMLAEVARLFGLPVANLKRDVQAVVTTAAIETDNYLLQYEIDKALLNMGYQGNRSNFMNILYAASVNDPEAYEIIYDDMVANGVTEEQIRTAMESRMKEEQGVESVSDLTRRYLTPTQERTYDRLYGQISSSPVWSAANAEQRAAVEEDLYNLTVGTDAGLTLREKIDAGAAYGISEADYLLYLAAREIADAENEDPEKRNGSIDQAEAQAAIDMLTGLSDEGRAYLWQSTNKGWKADNNPYQ